MNWSIFTSVTALAVYGGLVSSLRAAVKARKPTAEKALDVVVGMVMAASMAEYFVPSNAPKVAMFVGLIAGSFGGYLMDAIQALSPKLADGILEGVLGRFGYRRQPEAQPVIIPDEPSENEE